MDLDDFVGVRVVGDATMVTVNARGEGTFVDAVLLLGLQIAALETELATAGLA